LTNVGRAPERRLTIRSRRHEIVPSAANEAGAEAGHDVSAVVFERDWWHGDADIGGEQGHQRVDITGLPGANELSDERLLGRESGAGGGSRSRVGGR
jgi:hypothetical protein